MRYLFARPPTRPFLLRLPPDLHVRLKTLATVRRRSVNGLACEALEMWAEVLEDRVLCATGGALASAVSQQSARSRSRRARPAGPKGGRIATGGQVRRGAQ